MYGNVYTVTAHGKFWSEKNWQIESCCQFLSTNDYLIQSVVVIHTAHSPVCHPPIGSDQHSPIFYPSKISPHTVWYHLLHHVAQNGRGDNGEFDN